MNVSITKTNPATGAISWEGIAADVGQVEEAVLLARKAQKLWQRTPLVERIQCLENFANIAKTHSETLAHLISTETGKPLWESRTEVQAVIGKIPFTIEAYHAAAGDIASPTPIRLRWLKRSLGVIAVLGPFNMPAHLPHGQIAPALLAGNAVLFKPSPLAPATAEWMVQTWQKAGLPDGVLQILHGSGDIGEKLAISDGIDAVFFTGSRHVGGLLHRALADFPERLLALEMGGNNPLILGRFDNREAAIQLTMESAFITAGQRCTCARRLIVPQGYAGDTFLAELAEKTAAIRLGAPNETPEPFLGPVIHLGAAQRALAYQDNLIRQGARVWLPLEQRRAPLPFLRPGIVELSTHAPMQDEEIFAPFLVVQRVPDFHTALQTANATRFGLAAGLISDDPAEYELFAEEIEAGVLTWNCATAGASGRLPFGGRKASGNHRPAGWTMGASCSISVAARENSASLAVTTPLPGLLSTAP